LLYSHINDPHVKGGKRNYGKIKENRYAERMYNEKKQKGINVREIMSHTGLS